MSEAHIAQGPHVRTAYILNIVECRYNAVQYDNISHTPMCWLRQNISETLNPQTTPHTST